MFVTNRFENIFTQISKTTSFKQYLKKCPPWEETYLQADGDLLRKVKEETGDNTHDLINLNFTTDVKYAHHRCVITFQENTHCFWDAVHRLVYENILQNFIMSSLKSTHMIFKTANLNPSANADGDTDNQMAIAIFSNHTIYLHIQILADKNKHFSQIIIYLWESPLNNMLDHATNIEKTMYTWIDATAENKILAALMATHKRLGNDSKLGKLMNELFPTIVNEYDKINAYTWSEIRNMTITRRYLPHLALHIGHDGNGMGGVAHNGNPSGCRTLSSLVGI